MSNVWVIRAGRNAVHVETFLDKGVAAIGMSHKVGAEPLQDSRSALKKRTAAAHPDWSKHVVANHAGQLYRFLHEVKPGDTVATYHPHRRLYFLGTATDAPRFDGSVVEGLPYVRGVAWDRRAPRDRLSVSTRNTLGAIQTIFQLNKDAADELLAAARPLSDDDEADDAETPTASSDEPGETLADLRAEVAEKAEEFIEDMIAKLGPYELQELVAGILRAMGYKTRVSPPGPDRGVDIFASPDGLGLEEPRIFVEVKHRRSSTMGSHEVRSFLGGRQPGDRCLYVSTGGFTREARYEADRANVALTLIGMPELRELMVEHYGALDPQVKAMVPLVHLWWPAE